MDPGRRGAALLSVVAALAAVIAAVGVWWGRPEPRPVTPVALSQAAATVPSSTGTSGRMRGDGAPADGAAPAASPSARTTGAQQESSATAGTGPMLVSVTGKVRHPGLVTVPAGARVADAIAAAGGALHPEDLTGLNLAARLTDGDSVVVAGPAGSSADLAAGGGESAPGPSPPAPGAPEPGSEPIDINTADAAALQKLPGVGPVTAAAIVAWRTEHGKFTSVSQLQAVSGIGPAKYAQISPHVTV